jgi:5-methyltetrahydropteroyltriglutamate--homocysteine methyltransferase
MGALRLCSCPAPPHPVPLPQGEREPIHEVRSYHHDTGAPMIRTTVIGSWPLPEMYRERLLQYHRGTLPEMLIKPTLVGAAEIAISEQKATGVTQFMGGEFFAEVFIQHLPRKLTGVKLVKPQAAELKAYTDLAEYELTDDIDAPHGLGYIEAFRRESQLEPTLEKASVPGPLEVLAHIRPTPEVQRQISRAIEIVNREIHGLAAAGAREIQLDIPYIAIRSVLGQLAPEEAGDLIARSFAGVEALKTIHCCLGDLGSQSAITVHNLHALLPYIERLRGVIDKVHLECSHAGQWADRACLRDIPKELQVIAGIVDVKAPVEPAEQIAERIGEMLRFVEPERLWIAPSCGLGRRTTEIATGKLSRMVEAAKRF